MFEYNFFPENYDANIRPPDGKGHFLTSHFHTLNSNFISNNYKDNVRICFSSMGKIKIYKDRFGNGEATFEEFLSQFLNDEYSTQSCYLHKKSRYCGGGVYDPKCHTALRIIAGKNFLNQFMYENFSPSVASTWLKVSNGELLPLKFRKHFDFSPVFDITKENENYNIHSRFCGMSIENTLKELGLSDVDQAVWDKWKQRKVREQKVPFIRLQIEAMTQRIEEKLGDNISKIFKTDLKIFNDFVTHGDYDNLEKIDNYIEYLNDKLSAWDYKDIAERQYAFVLLLLFKSMYIENSLKMFKIDHGHLHFGNVTFELIDKDEKNPDITNLPINDHILFNKNVFLQNPKKYNLILRLIDLGKLAVKI